MIERAMVYDMTYALIARDGRQDALFGSYAARAREAYMRSLVGDAFPELWFELPLLGDPWFDLHVLTDRSTLSPGMSFTAYETGGYQETFAWFSGSRNTRQLSLSWDVGAGRLDCPAIQLLLSDTDAETACEFLASAGRAELGEPTGSLSSASRASGLRVMPGCSPSVQGWAFALSAFSERMCKMPMCRTHPCWSAICVPRATRQSAMRCSSVAPRW